MSGKSSKWLVGCGIGCGVVILLIIIIVAVGYFFVRDTVTSFKETEASMELVEERYGRVQDFCPDPEGSIAPDRIEAFLAVRDSMAWIRDEWEQGLDDFTEEIRGIEDEEKSFWRILGIIRKGAGAIPRLAEYYTIRNHELLDAGMGLGEYYYIYVVVYYSWLDKSPGEGPGFRLMGDDRGPGRFRWNRDEEEDERERDEEDVREERRYRIITKVRRMVRPMMRAQLEKLEETGIRNAWRKALETELEAMRDDRDRLPWQDGLPEVMEVSLRPYRERLEASYNEMLNALELMPEEY